MGQRGISDCSTSLKMDLSRLTIRNFVFVALFLIGFDGSAEGMLPSDLLLSYDISPPTPIVENSPTSWTEDENWWEGAEEIDLTIAFDKLSPEEVEDYLVLQEEDIFFNESTFLDIECEDFVGLPSPPVLEDVPPPPLPPFLVGMGEILQESFRQWHKRNTVDIHMVQDENDLFGRNLEWITFDDNKCSICDWANGGNDTIDLLAKKQADPDAKMNNTMVIILVGVALISAAIGATIMGLLLRCNKAKSFPCGSEKSWFRFGNRRIHTQSPEIPPRSNKSETPSNATGILPGFAMKLWRRGSSQAPLNPCSSPGSENSYSEEPYINADASSASYAELNSSSGIPGDLVVRLNPSTLSTAPYSNTYSEIPSPVHSADICSRLCPHHHEGTYENSGYLLSETPSDPNESSTGSNSTPSSAYYSDVSSSDVYTNKKKKKKRKGADDRTSSVPSSYPIIGGNLSPTVQGIPVICSHVSHQPVHLNINAVQSQYIPSRENNIPVTLQLLPRQMEQRISDNSSVPGHQPGVIVHNKNLTHSNIVHQNPGLLLNIRNHCYNPSQPTLVPPQSHHVPSSHCGSGHHLENNLQTCPSGTSNDHLGNTLEAQEELMLLQYNGNVVQRPLPPLPSRQTNDPRRRNFKVSLGLSGQNIPSEV